MANKKKAIKRVFGKNIKKYRELLGLSQSELAEYLDYGYTTVLSDEKNNRSLGIDKIYDYIDAFKYFSSVKSNGKQVLRLDPNDLVYEIVE